MAVRQGREPWEGRARVRLGGPGARQGRVPVPHSTAPFSLGGHPRGVAGMGPGLTRVPPGGWAAPQDHERVLRSVIRAAWPDREPTWPAFLEGGAVLRITDADANNWLPRALRSALAHWRYRRRNPPPSQPQPPHKRRRR